MPLVSPSILSADFANLQRDVELLNRSNSDWVHVDVMDGRFVPNISLGIPVCEAIKKNSTKPLDVHLMIVEPDNYLEAFRKAGADHLIVHIEACPHLQRTLGRIRELGAKAGVAVNPHTPVELLSEVLNDLDLVLLMSVNPGFGGQKFIENTYRKIDKLVRMRQERTADFLIEIDGGVNLLNAKKLVKSGADALVAGYIVFSNPDPLLVIDQLKNS